LANLAGSIFRWDVYRDDQIKKGYSVETVPFCRPGY
jgi:hypothetical protein